MHYVILRSHDDITRAGAKELVRMSHRGCCRGGPTAHPLVDLLPLLHPFWTYYHFSYFFGYYHFHVFLLDILPGWHVLGPFTRFTSIIWSFLVVCLVPVVNVHQFECFWRRKSSQDVWNQSVLAELFSCQNLSKIPLPPPRKWLGYVLICIFIW